MLICACGSAAVYHCTSCSPQSNLCINCISLHLSQNLEDCIKPIGLKQSGSNICERCKSEKAVKLGIFDNYTQRLCKICKSSADLCVDLKWSSFVSKPGDLETLAYRKSALSRLYLELDQTRALNTFSSAFESLKAEMVKIIEKLYLEKFKELTHFASDHDAVIMKIKKEAYDQCLQKEIDVESYGGRLLTSFIQKGTCDLSLVCPQLLVPSIEVFESALKVYFDGIQIKGKGKIDQCVYLFMPGKNILVEIKLEGLKKTEFMFDKNWNFEASWCLLDSGDIFLCGGNGRDSSEVMIVRTIPETIKTLQGFTGRSGHSLVQVGRDIFVFGGNKGNFTEKYSIDEDKWMVLTSLPIKIQRSSACRVKEGILITGSDTDKLLLYSIEDNSFSQIEFPLTGYTLRNKIIFVHDEILYCLTGDRLIIYHWPSRTHIKDHPINDRDWWSYSCPVIHNNCAYFIKYFVRNLWVVDLQTLKLSEISLASMN